MGARTETETGTEIKLGTEAETGTEIKAGMEAGVSTQKMAGSENGRAVQLSKRLQTLAVMVTPGSRVADVGCDHGFVSIYLVQQGISPSAIAADVRQGPLSRAQHHIRERGLEAYIETRLSDGLSEIRAGEADTLICAGMGGKLMQRILKEGEGVAAQFRELILQPQSELEEFRRFLRREGYQTVQEEIVCEEGKYYFFMKEIPSSAYRSGEGQVRLPREQVRDVSQRLADKYGGLLLQRLHPVLRDYLEFLQRTYSQAAEQIRRQAGNTQRGERRLAEIYSELADIEEAMGFYTQEGRERYGDSDN